LPPRAGRYVNRIAGHSVERLAASSYGIFAVAMTLLVLDLHTPDLQASRISTIHSERELGGALTAMAPQVITYLMSFLTPGDFLERPAGAAEPSRTQWPAPHVDPHRLSVCRFSHAVLNQVACGIHRLPPGAPLLLGQSIASWRRPPPELAMCREGRDCQERY
jgi:hypothetical protein